MQKQKVIILGSTGSLGTQTLKVLEKYREQFEVIGLLANKNGKALGDQQKKHNIKKAILADKTKQRLSLEEADIVVNVLPGVVGVEYSEEALACGKILLLGNKESLVAEGENLLKIAQKNAGKIIPLDSEHNAIFEILKQNPGKIPKSITLTCSGGPFLNFKSKDLERVTAEDALCHPRWKMGGKVTIESATLINKGLEIIEAHYLFALPLSRIKVKIHPECQIHGVVEFKDEQVAYLSSPDMREHIENAFRHLLGKNTRNAAQKIRPLNEILKEHKFEFKNPNHKLLPGIRLVLEAFEQGKIKNFLKKEEQIIENFLEEKLSFPEIFIQLKEL